MVSVQQHTFHLCQSLYQQMSALTHRSDGTEVSLCQIYGNHEMQDSDWQGSVVTFNLKWADGSWIGFNEIERLAIEHSIQLRTGLSSSHSPVASVAALSCTSLSDFVVSPATGRLFLLYWRLPRGARHLRRSSSRQSEPWKKLSRHLS
jgi:hypothetical protein